MIISGNGHGTARAYASDVLNIINGYRLVYARDEMFAASGKSRPPCDVLVSVLQPMDPAELRFRAGHLARLY